MPPLAAAVIAIGYLSTLSFPFLFDDLASIRDNPTLVSPFDLGSIWWFRPSRFVVYWSFAVNGLATGLTPWGLRLANLFIHFGAACLCGWIGRELALRLDRRAPRGVASLRHELVGLIAGLIIAAHPLATQAVTYVVQRTTSLAALWQLGAIALYLIARRRESLPLYVLSWGVAVLAALTKESAVALPFLVLLVEWRLARSSQEPRPGRRVLGLLPYVLVPALIAFVARLPSTFDWQTADQPHTSLEYFLTQLTVVPRYLGLAAWPMGQSLEHHVAIQRSVGVPVVLGLAVILALVALAFAVHRRWPLASLGIGWFLIALAPESSFIPISDVMNEHRAYLPMAGLAWVVAEPLAHLCERRRVGLLWVGLLVVGLTVVTVARNQVWRDGLSLWGDVVRKSPDWARGHNNYGMFLRQAGRPAEAEAAFRRALAADSGYVLARLNLAALIRPQGRRPEARRLLEEAHALEPSNWAVLNNLGIVLAADGDTLAAIRAYREAIARAPGRREPVDNLRRIDRSWPSGPP